MIDTGSDKGRQATRETKPTDSMQHKTILCGFTEWPRPSKTMLSQKSHKAGMKHILGVEQKKVERTTT